MEVCINDLIIACNLELSPIARYIYYSYIAKGYSCTLVLLLSTTYPLLLFEAAAIAGSTSVVGCESSRGALKMLVALSEKLSIGYSLTSRVGLTFGGGLLIGLSLLHTHVFSSVQLSYVCLYVHMCV